jgi:hypothetical protein
MLLETRGRECSWRGDAFGVARVAACPTRDPARFEQSDSIANPGGDQRPNNAGAAGGAGQVTRLLPIVLPPS